MARRGSLKRLVELKVITPEDAKKEIAKRYNDAVPEFAKNWGKITPKKGSAWESAMETLLGIDVDEAFRTKYEKGVKRMKKYFEALVKGKGTKLVDHMVEKLKKAVAG